MTHAEKLLNAALRRRHARGLVVSGSGRRRARRCGRAYLRGYLEGLEHIGTADLLTEASG